MICDFLALTTEPLTKLLDESGQIPAQAERDGLETPFEADAQLAEPGKPGMHALVKPAMLAAAVALPDPACDSRANAALA